MIILDRKKAEKILHLKQIIKYPLLSVVLLSAFFCLGYLLYGINYNEITSDSDKLSKKDLQVSSDNISSPINSENNLLASLPQDWILYSKEQQQVSTALKTFNQTLSQLDKEYQNKVKVRNEQRKNIDIGADMPQEELDKLYEEELPNNIIDDNEEQASPEQLSEGYHIYNRNANVKDFNIIPKYKPAYFGNQAVIAVVIDDMGIAKKRTSDIISLQAPLTAAFLTYGPQLNQQVQNAQQAGMEIMLHAPMEPYSKIDLAPDMLTVQMDEKQIQEKLKSMIEKFDNIKGINNHMGSKFTENEEKMSAVMQVLKEKDLFFLDSKTTSKSVGKEVAQKYGVSYATRHVFIDNKNQKDYILKQLTIAENIAKKNGYAVAIGHPKSETYLALKEWLPSLKEKNIKIIPLSQIAKVLRQSHI